MTTWPEYLRNSIGVKISACVCLISVVSIIICTIIEKNRGHSGITKGDPNLTSVLTIRKISTGALIGYIVTVAIAVAQFIFRFGFFSLLQEIGAVFVGFIGAIIGALCGLIKWKVIKVSKVNGENQEESAPDTRQSHQLRHPRDK